MRNLHGPGTPSLLLLAAEACLVIGSTIFYVVVLRMSPMLVNQECGHVFNSASPDENACIFGAIRNVLGLGMSPLLTVLWLVLAMSIARSFVRINRPIGEAPIG